MSWLSEAWDGVSGFVKENKDWLQPAVKTVTGALNQQNVDNSQSQYLNYLREKEMKNYQDYVAQAQMYNAGVGSGGGGGGNGAAMANQAAAMGASKKANKKMQETYKKILAMYQPYKDVADRLLPQKTKTYEDSLALMGNMNNFVSSPEQMAKLNGSVPSWMVNVPLPDSVRIK